MQVGKLGCILCLSVLSQSGHRGLGTQDHWSMPSVLMQDIPMSITVSSCCIKIEFSTNNSRASQEAGSKLACPQILACHQIPLPQIQAAFALLLCWFAQL